MKTIHQIIIKVFSHEKYSDNETIILNKFLQFFPFDIKDEKIELKKTNALGFNENNIIIFEVILKKERHTQQFLNNLLLNMDNEQKKLIFEQLDSRLGENLDFFLRFNKDEYIKNDKLMLTDSGNCIHVKLSIAAYPKKREIGLGIVKEIFGNNIQISRL